MIEEKTSNMGVYNRVVINRYKCKICNGEPLKDFGYCKNLDGEGHLYDCVDYVEPEWMLNWMKRIHKKSKNPYISNFVKWSSKKR